MKLFRAQRVKLLLSRSWRLSTFGRDCSAHIKPRPINPRSINNWFCEIYSNNRFIACFSFVANPLRRPNCTIFHSFLFLFFSLATRMESFCSPGNALHLNDINRRSVAQRFDCCSFFSDYPNVFMDIKCSEFVKMLACSRTIQRSSKNGN